MSKAVRLGFAPERIEVPIGDLLPNKVVAASVKKTKKYQQILSSIREVGIVEPLMVYGGQGDRSKLLLLDGHLRLEALKDLEFETAPCLIAKDDEAFTYNKQISRLASVQEHYMVLTAIENGVSEERIAQALGVNIARIRTKANLLNGISPEAVDILKDRHFPTGTISIMKRMKPLRQVEMAELMVASNNFSISYARAMLIATPDEDLVQPERKKAVGKISDTERKQMEHELEKLRRDMKAVADDYGVNMLRLVVANGYVTRILENDHVVHYMARNHDELLTQLQQITETIAADTGTSLVTEPES